MCIDSSIHEIAALAGGCFWCLEAIYIELMGVLSVEPGYTGGYIPNPTYEQVCTDTTGHAEVVQITFDPSVVSFRELLEVFFTIHDPTTLNRQGVDVGRQYRSAIFYHNLEQKAVANQVITDLQGKNIWLDPIVTEINPLTIFYPAEAYHRNYYSNNPGHGYCQAVITPKVVKFRQKYINKLNRKE